MKISIKKFIVKTKLKFEDQKHCLEATQLENKMNHLEKKILIIYQKIARNIYRNELRAKKKSKNDFAKYFFQVDE